MIAQRLRFVGLAGFSLLALTLAGCASSGMTAATAQTQDEQLAPVQSGNVSTAALPPIGPNG